MNKPILSKVSTTVAALGECLTLASALAGKAIDPLAMRAWIRQFSTYSSDEIQESFLAWFSRHKAFPSISDIVVEIDCSRFGGPAGAWLLARNAAAADAESGAWNFVVFEHPGIHFAIEFIGGFGSLKSTLRDHKEASFARSAFVKAFESYRPGLEYSAGFGCFSGDNVVLIGNPARAMDVYKGGTKYFDRSRNVQVDPDDPLAFMSQYANSARITMPSTLASANLLPVREQALQPLTLE